MAPGKSISDALLEVSKSNALVYNQLYYHANEWRPERETDRHPFCRKTTFEPHFPPLWQTSLTTQYDYFTFRRYTSTSFSSAWHMPIAHSPTLRHPDSHDSWQTIYQPNQSTAPPKKIPRFLSRHQQTLHRSPEAPNHPCQTIAPTTSFPQSLHSQNSTQYIWSKTNVTHFL